MGRPTTFCRRLIRFVTMDLNCPITAPNEFGCNVLVGATRRVAPICS